MLNSAVFALKAVIVSILVLVCVTALTVFSLVAYAGKHIFDWLQRHRIQARFKSWRQHVLHK